MADFENAGNILFIYFYDLTYFFEKYNYLNQSKIAGVAGINPGLIRQYSSGHKQPSKTQVGKIEKAVHQIGSQLSLVQLSARRVTVPGKNKRDSKVS